MNQKTQEQQKNQLFQDTQSYTGQSHGDKFLLEDHYLLQWIKHQNYTFLYNKSESELNNQFILHLKAQVVHENEIQFDSDKTQFLTKFILKMFSNIDFQYFKLFLIEVKQNQDNYQNKEQRMNLTTTTAIRDFVIKSFELLQAYLQQNLGKKMSKINREKFNKLKNDQSESTEEQIKNNLLQVIKIQIYISVQCKNKAHFIQTICQLSQQVQNQLMNHVNSVQNTLQNILQVKQILSNILQLQQENQQLQKNIISVSSQNNVIQSQITESMNEQKRLLQQITQYNAEKEDLFKMLHITTIQEFIQIYKQIQKQTQNLQATIQEISQRNAQIQRNNLQTISKINQNAMQITKTNDQITSLKTVLQNLKDDISLYDEYCSSPCSGITDNSDQGQNKYIDQEAQNNHVSTSFREKPKSKFRYQQFSPDKETINIKSSKNKLNNHKMKNILGENKDILNEKLLQQNQNYVKCTKFIGKDQKFINSSRNYQFDESTIQGQSFEEECLQIDGQKQKYRKQLMIKLQKLYTEISAVTKEITQFKEENKNLSKKNIKNEKKLRDLKNLHQAFVKQYQYNLN